MSALRSRADSVRHKPRRMTPTEIAALGVAYLSGESIPQLIDRFGLGRIEALEHQIKKLAHRQWQAMRRVALAKRGETE